MIRCAILLIIMRFVQGCNTISVTIEGDFVVTPVTIIDVRGE